MLYYLVATFLPIDKLIGKLYPIFGGCLIVMAIGLMGAEPSTNAAFKLPTVP